MTTTSAIVQHIDYLTALGADQVAHRNGSLLSHLLGTWQLLDSWHNPPATCLAGLYHSVYSTGGFEQQMVALEQRNEIRRMIGGQAEMNAYLFGACGRPETHPRIGRDHPALFHDRFSGEDYPLAFAQWSALCEIMLANELDLGRYDQPFYRKHLDHYQDLFRRFEPWLSRAAINARREFEAGLNLP